MDFEITYGPNQGLTGSDITDTNGEATFTYDGSEVVGIDTIQACYGDELERVCSQPIIKVWIPSTCPNIELGPAYDLNLVGEQHTVTATIDSGIPGTSVTFTVISGPNLGTSGIVSTDSLNSASFSYENSGGIGTDRIQACYLCILAGATVCSNIVEKEWTKEILVLSPSRATNLVGTEHTVTATLTKLQDGTPISGKLVDFEITSGPNQGLTDSDDTDANGEASFTYTSNGNQGTDVIQACFTNAEGNQICTDKGLPIGGGAVKEWCPGITIGPDTETLPSGAVGVFYSQTITSSVEPAIFQLTGDLPPGLEQKQGSIIIEGTPTQAGKWQFTVTAATEQGCTESRVYTVNVDDATIPTVNEWGMILTALLLSLAIVICYRRREG